MFRVCYEDLENGLENPTSINEYYFINPLIETFLLHFRNLYVFFYTKLNNRDHDDVLAEDYIIDTKNFYEKRTQKKEFKKHIIKVNKMSLHLTYSRDKYIFNQDNLWFFTELFKLIEKTEVIFYDLILREKKYKFK
jgi:hypothetical protein